MSKPKKPAAGCCMYLGPTIGGVIRAGQIFGKPAAAVRKSLKNLPAKAAPLIVDGDDLPQARADLRAQDSALRYYYDSLTKR